MTYRYAPAAGSKAAFILGLTGPSRSGKTYSALRLATGMADGDASKIFVLDTERGRAAMYAPRFGRFMHCIMDPPFSYENYAKAIDDGAEQGAHIIIVDSLSHAHEGEGGMLEQHEAEVQRRAGNDYKKREKVKFAAWIEPKRQVTRFVHAILRARAPMIFCFRAKEKIKPVPGGQPINLGFRPICSDEITFEMTSMLLLPEKAGGVPDLEATATAFREPFDTFFKPGDVLDQAMGEKIEQFISGGEKYHAAPQQSKPAASEAGPDEELFRYARKKASEGTVAIRDTFELEFGDEQKKKLETIKRELWEIAKKADAQQAGSPDPPGNEDANR